MTKDGNNGVKHEHPPLEEAFFETAPETDQGALVGAPQAVWRAVRRAIPVVLVVLAVLAVALVLYAGPVPATHADTPVLVDAARARGAELGRDLGIPSPGPLYAAVGTYPVTPDPPNYVRLAGYGPAVRKSLGLDGEVTSFAWLMRAGAGPTCAIMGADLLLVTPDLAESVATEVNALARIPREHILFTASHSHSSLGGYGRTPAEGWLLGAAETVLEFLSMRWAPTAWGASRELRPAVIRAGQPQAPSLIYNRLDKQGTEDATLDVLQLDVNGNEPALLVFYGAHPTSESRRDWLSPDYPGFLRKTVSEHVGAFVSFGAGPMGSMGVHSPTGERTPGVVGKLLATPVMGAFRPRSINEPVSPSEARVACGRAELPLPPLRVPVVGSWALTERASELLLTPPPAFHVSALVVGPALVVSVPGELSGEVTLPLRERARKKGYSLVVASFSGEYAGYLLPAERYGKGVEGPLQLAGVGAAAPTVAFIEGLVDALPQGPVPADAPVEKVWPQ
ncbi:MAG: hypothetical protein AB2A00_30000 [Myxococcota bacterium]